MLVSRQQDPTFADLETFVHRDGSRSLTGDWPVGGFKIRDVVDPALAQDVATKGYVDGLLSGVVTLNTLDATPTAIWVLTLPDNTSVSVRAHVSAQQVGGAHRAGYQLLAVGYRTGGGPATLLGSTLVISEKESNAAWDVDFDVAGNQLQLLVTGAAASIDWTATIERVQAP